MRSSKKRKIAGRPMKPVNVLVTVETRDKLDKMAGEESLGYMVETLIEREYERRVKRQSQQVHELPLKTS